MVVTSHNRGHKIEYQGKWVYSDTKGDASTERPCIRCGRIPTVEGYDACLGHIPNATGACCGHGVEKGILIYD